MVLPWKYGIPGLKKYIINYITRKLLVLSNTSNKVLFRPDAKNKVFHGRCIILLIFLLISKVKRNGISVEGWNTRFRKVMLEVELKVLLNFNDIYNKVLFMPGLKSKVFHGSMEDVLLY